jgi:hypothetical protein
MYVLTLIAPAFLVTTVLVVLPHFAIAQTASLDCMQLSNPITRPLSRCGCKLPRQSILLEQRRPVELPLGRSG